MDIFFMQNFTIKCKQLEINHVKIICQHREVIYAQSYEWYFQNVKDEGDKSIRHS